MKAVPYNEGGISHDDFMGDDALECPVKGEGSDFDLLRGAWIDAQAKELGGEAVGVQPDGKAWRFLDGDGEPWTMSGDELVEFVKEQVGSLPVGFWILQDHHYEAALVPLETVADHGGATIHACAEVSFMRICALLAACTVGNADPPGVTGGGGGDDDEHEHD